MKFFAGLHWAAEGCFLLLQTEVDTFRPPTTRMKNLPKIRYWWETIDGQALAVNACRGYAEPSNGVFMLVAKPAKGYFTVRERDELQAELDRRIKARERQLHAWYGRHWRHHLTDRVSADGRCSGTPM